MEFETFLKKETVSLIPVLWIIGTIIKTTNLMPSCYIPFVLLIISCIISAFINGNNAQAFIQGVLATGLAVFGHQIYKQGQELITL